MSPMILTGRVQRARVPRPFSFQVNTTEQEVLVPGEREMLYRSVCGSWWLVAGGEQVHAGEQRDCRCVCIHVCVLRRPTH